MRYSLIVLLSLAALLPAPAPAKGSADVTGYTRDLDGRCQVWAPSMLGQQEYALRYRGACKNGRAEGKGKAEWLYRYAELKVKATWDGEFRNGVFLDGQKVKGSVTPVQGDRYVVEMGAVDGARLFFVSRSPQDQPMALCEVEEVGAVLGPGMAPADDARVRRVMEGAGRAFHAVCPRVGREVRIGVHAEPIEPRPNGMLPNPMAVASFSPGAGELSDYSNESASKAREERQHADYDRKRDEVRRRFDEFSRKHGIAAWVTVKQLDENPFRWEGKTVGVVVRLDRMLARDSALVQTGLRDWGPPVVLTGISPDFPGSDRTVLVAAVVGKREPLPGSESREVTYSTLRHLESRSCELAGCADWFIWARGPRELVWGEPYRGR